MAKVNVGRKILDANEKYALKNRELLAQHGNRCFVSRRLAQDRDVHSVGPVRRALLGRAGGTMAEPVKDMP